MKNFLFLSLAIMFSVLLIVFVLFYFFYLKYINNNYKEIAILGWFFYLLAVNLLSVAVFFVDKLSSIKKTKRIREYILLFFVSLGGGLSIPFFMLLIGHKTSEEKFLFKLTVLFFFLFWLIFTFLIIKRLI